MLDWSLTVRGFRGTKRLMRELEPELLKQMNRTVRRQLEPIVTRAKRNVPMQAPLSGWARMPYAPYTGVPYSPYGRRWEYERLEWNTPEARKNIVIRQPGRRSRGGVTRTLYQLQSNQPAAAVFELMGRGKSRVHMVSNMRNKYPGTGRVLYKAFDMTGGAKIEREVVNTVKKFEAEFNRRLDAAGG